ncbi:MAG: pseudouridine synthase [Gammaproteobacteria bacterium]
MTAICYATPIMDIIYLDNYFVAVNKPAGLLVHRSNIDRHETEFAVQKTRNMLGQHVFPVHRLDKPTSGVLLFALEQRSARKMGELFTNGEIKKTYTAIVRGYTEETGTIEHPLKERRDKMIPVKKRTQQSKKNAITSYRRLATADLPYSVSRHPSTRYSVLNISPVTGRRHQIRRHMKHVFHPIIGDTTYGDGRHNVFFRSQFSCHRLLLASTSLVFNHPYTNLPTRITAPLDHDFSKVMAELGWGHLLEPDKRIF